MLKHTKFRLAALSLVAMGALSAAPGFAQPADCMGGPMGRPQAEGRQADRMKQHQQRLHDALKLTPQQEKAWEQFQSSHPAQAGGQRPDPAEFAKLPAPERAEKMLAVQKQQQEAMGKHVAAMKEFYAQLTPEQKATFDAQGMRGPRQGGKRGPGAGGPGAGGPGAGAPGNPQ